MAPLGSEICIRLVVTFDDFPDVGMPNTNLASNLTFTKPVVMQVQYSVSVHRRQRTTIVVYPTVDVLSWLNISCRNKCATTWQFIVNIHVNFEKYQIKEAYKYSDVHSLSVNPRFQWGNQQTDLKQMKIARGLNWRQIVAANCLLLRPFTYAFWLVIWYGSCQKDVKKLSKTFHCGNGRARSTVNYLGNFWKY